MKYALKLDERIEATPKASAICPCCGTEVIAKCGNRKVWHWAHKTKQTCDHWWENETQWHRDWKDKFPKEWQEIIHVAENGEKHIADVKTDKGLVIEFQRSSITREEIEVRSNFYENMIWIIDTTRVKRNHDEFCNYMSDITNEHFVYSINDGSKWGSLKVPVFDDVGIDDWLIGQVPQREADYGFYNRHYLKKDYFTRSLVKSGKYQAPRIRTPQGRRDYLGRLIPSDNLYEFLKIK